LKLVKRTLKEEEITKMTEIVHENEDTRLVRLDEQYYSGEGQLIQLFARFNEHTIVLSHSYSISGKPKSFMLNTAEMEALANAWIAYTNDRREKAEIEAQRLINVEAEAYRLASMCKAIQIEKRNDGGLRWNVTMPDFGWHGCSYVADDLLECVKQAVDYCRPIQEAYKLAKDYPAINFQHQKGSAGWWISINNLFGDHAYAGTILEVVQQAIAKYVEHQDQLIYTEEELQNSEKL
jgi:hypothetical protein